MARLLDTRFRFFGIPIGLDSMLGLIPGLGDFVTSLPTAWMIWRGRRLGARKRVLARMAANAGLDLTLGAIPVVGDAFDLAFKAHRRNADLLHRELGGHPGHA